jgi:lambda family phage portal protein
MVRDCSYARRGIDVLDEWTVGEGLRPRPIGAESTVNQHLDLWEEWGETTACDIEGQNNIYQLQSLAMRTTAERGDILVRRIINPDWQPLPLKLQLLEGDFLDHTKEADTDSERIIQGVQLTPWSERLGYWIHDRHPGDSGAYFKWDASRFVPAVDVIHLFRQDRAHQVRGIPWGSTCLFRLRDYDLYADAQLLRQQIASMFVGFVTDPDAAQIDAPAEGSNAEDRRVFDMEAGTLEYLPLGKEVNFSSPPHAEGMSEYASLTLHEIAMGFGISTSSGRMDRKPTGDDRSRQRDCSETRRDSRWPDKPVGSNPRATQRPAQDTDRARVRPEAHRRSQAQA